jgi:mannan endo-1,4-beta-mannosidase
MVDYLKQITGKNAVAGVHNRVNADVNWDDIAQWRPTGPSVFTNYARQITGKTPGMWSGDFLFDYPNALSSSRWSMIYEAERQYNAGALVNIMFHTCNPRLRENEATQCSWGDRTNGPQSRLSDDEWSRLITDGGDLNRNWKERLDNIAVYLQYLKNKNVEVMFRPLHEMNQGAFWWGGRSGSQGTRRLYQITHDYLTKTKGLTNLIWVWNVQDLAGFSDELVSSYNPGNSYWDIATLDVYEGFDPWKYEVMVRASNGKPIAIGECSVLPSVEILNAQPNWSFFMSWSELTFKENSNAGISSVYNSNRVITLEEMPGWK